MRLILNILNEKNQSVIHNIPQLKRKEKSIYKPSDLWTPEDDLLFLRYCQSKRDKCYHAVSRDLSARPHEILKLKIRNISFKQVGSAGHQVFGSLRDLGRWTETNMCERIKFHSACSVS